MTGTTHRQPSSPPPPLWLSAFCYALMGPACAINAVLVAISIPALATHGFWGLSVAAAIGAGIGIWPARWMARKIHAGIGDDG